MMREELRPGLQQLIAEARAHGVSARKHALQWDFGEEARTLDLELIPFVHAAQQFFQEVRCA
jgi:hypothetical protein